MGGPRAVVLPFAVPDGERGLGLGLAAMVHGFVRVGGESVALAQLHGHKPGEDTAPAPVEAFVPPPAWADLASRSAGSDEVELVLTGSFEPPRDGEGTLRWLAYDPRSGATRASGEDAIDEGHAGKAVVTALESLGANLGADLGPMRDLGDLDWGTLEHVLRAERCALGDPLRGGAPHDPAAAVGHLERAVAEAPAARFPASRLAALALEVGAIGGAIGQAALRALARASADAPSNGDLLEATAALALRLGDPAAAETRALGAIGVAPDHPRLWAIVSEARRAQGNVDGAHEAVMSGLRAAPVDPVLTTELGIVHAQRTEVEAAMASWMLVLERTPLFLPAFMNLAQLSLARGDAVLMQKLVDHALALPAPHPEMLRRGVQLALAAEPEGVARATRVAELARRITRVAPDDAAARVILAQSLVLLGDRDAALTELARVERTAKGTPAAAEAQRGLLALRDPDAAKAIDATMLAARTAPVEELPSIAERARALREKHGAWAAGFAEAIARGRMGHKFAAKEAFELVLELAPGCLPAHAELVGACVETGEAEAALAHAEALHAAEGDTPRVLVLMARAKRACGLEAEARAMASRVLAVDPSNAEAKELAAPPAPEPRVSWIRRVLGLGGKKP